MIINDISRNKWVRYFSGPSDTSDTSSTANSSDASKTSTSVTRQNVIVINSAQLFACINFSSACPLSRRDGHNIAVGNCLCQYHSLDLIEMTMSKGKTVSRIDVGRR